MPFVQVVGGLFGLLAWVVLLGLQRIWHYTFGWLFTTLAGLLDNVSVSVPGWHRIHVVGPVSAWLRSLDRNVAHALAVAALDMEKPAVWLFGRARWALHRIAQEVEGVAADAFHAVRRLYLRTLPRLARRLLRLFTRLLRAVRRVARHALRYAIRQAHRVLRFARHVYRWALRELRRVRRLALHAIRTVLRALRAVYRRLHRLERFLLGKGFRKLVVGVLRWLGLHWLWAFPMLLVGRAIARWSWHVVTAFVRTFEAYGNPFGLADFAHALQTPTREISSFLHKRILDFTPVREAPGPPNLPPEI